MMKYKGYVGHVTYDAEARLFHGEILGLKDVITFQGTSVNQLEKAFKDSIEDYLEWCNDRGEKPEKEFSGKIHIRIQPQLHAKLIQEAALRNESLNALIEEKLQK